MVTQKEIAKSLNLSHQVVSLCFTHPDRVHPETKEKIMKTADELGYRLNNSARAIRTGRFDNIVLITSTDQNRILKSPDLMYGIHDELAKADIHLTLAALADQKLEKESFVPKILQKWNSDGMLINYSSEIPERLISLIEKYQIPSIWLQTKQDKDCIYPDYYNAGKEATKYLLTLGHRKIAYADFTCMSHYSAIDIRESYIRTMKSAGCEVMLIGCQKLVPRNERLMAAHDYLLKNSPTAIISFASSTLLPILQVLNYKSLSIPSEVSLIAFSDSLYDETGIEVSTMVCPYFEMGINAVKMLKKKIKKPKFSLKSNSLPLSFIEGKSCAYLKTGKRSKH